MNLILSTAGIVSAMLSVALETDVQYPGRWRPQVWKQP
uniref:Uncharacterized protein n=1 Tax=Rhizophora mucronata TaxID=61149 RepID=A0A2P2Q2I3_RHIMU